MKQKIVRYILDFAESRLDYLILRNYENLPEEEGHDIDLLIKDEELPITSELIKDIKDHFDVRIFKRQQYYGLCGFAIVVGETVLHLDFFTQVQWNRFSIIPTEVLLSRKKRYNGSLWVISDEDLSYYCWVMYIRSKGNIKDKYKKLAFDWGDNHHPKINIRTGSANMNKFMLIKSLISQNSMRKTIINTLANIRFKIWKFSCMDGRIYVTTDLDNPIVQTARRYCSCNRFDVQYAKDLSWISTLRLLYQEYSIGISPEEWGKLWWHQFVPKIYVISQASNLIEVVRNIYRDVEI